MNNKKKILPIVLSAVMLGSTLTGCTDLVYTNSEKDMNQIVATVDISLNEDFKNGEYKQYADVISESAVTKRDLVAYFINQGYYLVSSSGYTYKQAFDTMLDNLVNRKIVVQYAMVYFFENSEEYTLAGYNAAINNSEHPAIDGLKYFLTEDEYEKALYSLRKSINSSLDSNEKSFIKEAEGATYEDSVRTTPTGVDSEEEDYYDSSYRIYTGRNAASACGSYETVDGSTTTTRKKAYNEFLSSLKSNYLLKDGEQTSEFETLTYWYDELEGQLESALVTKLGDDLEEKAKSSLTEEFVQERYNEIFNTQKQTYDSSSDSFETDIDALSDTKFVLYSPTSGYGFVYNILLPFSTSQSYKLSEYTNDTGLTSAQRYEKRAEILDEVQATDQRGSWLTGETDYSFKASEKGMDKYGASDYLFFENNMIKNERYETINNYYGHYSYNGTVEYDESEADYNGYTLTPNKLSVNGFIDEMEGYLKYAGLIASGDYVDTYARKAADFLDEDNGIDYSKFVYYKGSVEVDYNANTVFEKNSKAYKATSVINELSFAYNTDTGGLNSYLGYSVSAYDTNFVKEFEYAAKLAVENGVGSYVIAPSDYGWHIMYCSFVMNEGEIYKFDWADKDTEGTFSYLFYEALKESTSGSSTQVFENKIINAYNNDSCVELFRERYKNYSSLETPETES